MISLDKDLNSKPKFHYKFSIINFVAHSIFVNVLLVFLCICLFVCVLAYWLLIFMSVCSLIFIWLHTHGETRKYAQFVCECLGVPRPSPASPRTAPGLKQCTAPAWPARTAEQREPEAEEAPANSQSASTLLSARARTNLRPSLAFQVEPARSAVRLLVRDVSERAGWSWVVDSTSWPSSVFLARVRPAAVQRVRLSFCSQLSSRSMEPRLSQGKNVKNVLLLWSCSILYNGLHSNSMAEIKPLISSHNQLEYNK